MTGGRFVNTFRGVTIVHFLIVLGIVLSYFLGSLFSRSKPKSIPIEFVVAVPTEARSVEPEKKAVVPKPDKKTPVTPKKKVEKSTKVVKKTSSAQTTPQKTLSEDEIKKLLSRGAKPSDHTFVPDDDSICFEMIRVAFYNAWNQPSSAEAGNSVAEVKITFSADGSVMDSKLAKRSGNSVFDESVVTAMGAVKKVSGLSASFLSRHRSVNIAFKVEP